MFILKHLIEEVLYSCKMVLYHDQRGCRIALSNITFSYLYIKYKMQ